MTELAQREHIVGLIDEAVSDGASPTKACQVIEVFDRASRRPYTKFPRRTTKFTFNDCKC